MYHLYLKRKIELTIVRSKVLLLLYRKLDSITIEIIELVKDNNELEHKKTKVFLFPFIFNNKRNDL